MVLPNTLADIRAKVRKLVARSSQSQITDAQIDGFINTYYLYDMPETLRLLKLKDIFTFTTQPNIEFYQFDNTNYITCEPPAYCGGQQIQYFQDLDTFYRQWPKINYLQTIAVGTGSAGPYTSTLSATPILRSNNISTTSQIGRDVRILFTANISGSVATSAIDNGNGGFVDAITGTPLPGSINYTTGLFTITFSSTVPAGTAITAETIPYVASQPRSICFYQNQFLLRPVPDKAYLVEVNAFRYPTQLINTNSSPELAFWWQLLAYGAALKILVENGDYENAEALRPYYTEQLLLVQRRTIKQQTNQRSQTIYSAQGDLMYTNFYPYSF